MLGQRQPSYILQQEIHSNSTYNGLDILNAFTTYNVFLGMQPNRKSGTECKKFPRNQMKYIYTIYTPSQFYQPYDIRNLN